VEDIQRRIAELTDRLAKWQIEGETYERILDLLPSGILVVSYDGTIRLANQEILRMFRYQREELVGRQVHVLLDPVLTETHAAHVRRFFADPGRRAMGEGREFSGRRSDGGAVIVQISIGTVGPLGLAVVREVGNGGA
jgi:PAS domain S-box-containing protein